MSKNLTSFILVTLYLFSNAAFALTKVTLSDVHICCVTCQEAIEHAVLGVKGANVSVDRDTYSVAMYASSPTTILEIAKINLI